MCFSGHANLETELSKALDKMGHTTIEREEEEDEIGLAFQKFAVVTKELGALMKNMVSIICTLNHIGDKSLKMFWDKRDAA